MCFDYLGFFGESNDDLIKYIENIDNLFFTKISQLYYDQARTIIKKDLNDLIEVYNVSCIDFLLILLIIDIINFLQDYVWNTNDEIKDDNGFCQHLFAYPQSKVR